MKQKLKVVFLTPEVAPIAKVGGLADVVGALPKNLIELGVDARIIVPRYEQIELDRLGAKKIGKISVAFGQKKYPITIYKASLPNSAVVTYLLDEPTRLSQGTIYSHKEDQQNALTERFLFLCQGALATLKYLKFAPDLIHAHDWPTAPVSLLLKNLKNDLFYKNTKSLVTIHNIHSQNYASERILSQTGLTAKNFDPDTRSGTNTKYFNLLAQGLLSADAVNTVSPKYATEIMKPPLSVGLEKILKKRKDKILGILNGIDTEYFNPTADSYINTTYDQSCPEKKSHNKAVLQKELGLESGHSKILGGVVTRLVGQKGLELILDVIKKKDSDFQFVVLGTGEKKYESAMTDLAKLHPGRLAFVNRYDSHLARRIYAGCDIFLMPSKFEPCGLTQMIAMRYGTLPVVRDTGGLHDTVINYNKPRGNGFVFEPFTTDALWGAMKEARKIYKFPNIWRRLQKNAMKQDFSWKKSADQYLNLYKKICNLKI